jgi:hypothetical protein
LVENWGIGEVEELGEGEEISVGVGGDKRRVVENRRERRRKKRRKSG